MHFRTIRFRTDWREKRLKTGRAADSDGSDLGERVGAVHRVWLMYLRNLDLQMAELTLGLSRIIKDRRLGGCCPRVGVAGMHLA